MLHILCCMGCYICVIQSVSHIMSYIRYVRYSLLYGLLHTYCIITFVSHMLNYIRQFTYSLLHGYYINYVLYLYGLCHIYWVICDTCFCRVGCSIYKVQFIAYVHRDTVTSSKHYFQGLVSILRQRMPISVHWQTSSAHTRTCRSFRFKNYLPIKLIINHESCRKHKI